MKGQQPPGPRGALASVDNTRAFHKNIFEFLSRIAAEYGDVAAFDLGERTCVLVNRADLVRTLYSRHEDDLRKPDFLTISNRGHWGDGLTTLDMVDWRLRRPLLRPAFQSRAIAPRLDLARECTADMIADWAPGKYLDMTREIRLLAARLATRSVLDADVEGYGDPVQRSGTIPVTEAMGEEFIAPGGGYGDAQFEMVRPRAGRDMSQTIKIIDARVAGAEVRDDVLSNWLGEIERSGQDLDRDTVRGEMIQMIFASHLTLPLSLKAVWRALAHHPEIAFAVASEADGMNWSRPDLQNTLSESFAMSAVREALRLAPPAPILYREAVSGFDLDNFHIEAGHAVWVAPRLLHLDRRYFANPTSFDPRRFSRGGFTPQSISAYMPFGSGPRTCIASRQSFLQMAVIVLLVAERVRLVPQEKSTDGFRVLARST